MRERVSQSRIENTERTLMMKGSAVVWSDTGERHIVSSTDLSMFDRNPGIKERRAATIPARLESMRRNRAKSV